MRIKSADELEVCEEVGRGGFGVVYRGIVKQTQEEVAIKQIDLENDQTDFFEVNKEIAIISECRLPQITRYLGCFERHFKLWVIMEFMNGGSVFELLKPGPMANESTIALVVREIVVALEYLHGQGKIHRDLKSQNVLLNTNGEVKLTDFGVSTQLLSNFSRRNTTVGTPYWMAPEVILNNNGGHSYKADIWLLGCCAYELFTGRPPLQNQHPPMKALRFISRCVKNDDFTQLIGLGELDISDPFKDFLTQCFTVNPKQRPSASQILKHPFIVANCTLASEPLQRKSLKQLITRKHLWDQDNHVHKHQRFYMPTELVNNQKKWNDDGKQKSIHFDMFSVNLPLALTPPPSHNALSPTSTAVTRESSASPDMKLDTYRRNLHQELNKIVNKVFHRIDNKNTLTTEQYDQLVSLNENISNLVTFTHDDMTPPRILVFQYLKYFLKEVTKPASDDVRVALQRAIIPSHFKTNEGLLSADKRISLSRLLSQFDEIENSLFESWIDRMKSK